MARITPDIVAELKSQVDIAHIIEGFIPVKKRGNRFMAVCPFHDDHSPSMNITPSMGIYKCFACGAGGDAFKFVMEYEKLDFGSAIEYVANVYNYQLPADKPQTPEEKALKEQKTLLLDANKVATNLFIRQYERSVEAKAYLTEGKHFACRIKESSFFETVNDGRSVLEW